MWKNFPKENVEGADTVLRGIARAPEGFSKGKPKAAKPRGSSSRGSGGFSRGKSRGRSMSSKVYKNCSLSPVACGKLNLTLLPIDVCRGV